MIKKDRFDIFIDLANDAIEKCLDRLKDLDPIDDVYLMQQFARGLALIAGYRDLAKKKSLPCLDRLPGKRPGIGMIRGFDEFNCGDEVLDAIYKLEHYFKTM